MEGLDRLTDKELLQLYRLIKSHIEYLENEEKKLKDDVSQ